MADRPARRARATTKPTKRAKPGKPPKREQQAKPRRRVVVRTALFLVVLVGLLFVFVYPTRTFLDQRHQTNDARAQLALLHAENAKLADQAERLRRDDVIEQVAREQYGLVKPGEIPFVILPAPTTTTAPAAPASPTSTTKPSP